MRHHLILKLQSPLQAWGEHSFEGLRPSALYPGRSALLGLLGACLGIDRQDRGRQQALAASVGFAVRVDQRASKPVKMTDYHTVKNARVKYQGLKSHDTIQTWREYIQDAAYTIAVWNLSEADVSLAMVREAVHKPVFTPVLGRRSCPLARPLFEAEVEAIDAVAALSLVEPAQGTIYSEEGAAAQRQVQRRDAPIIHQPRQFSTRRVYVHTAKGSSDVSE